MGFGKDGKGVIIYESRSQAIGVLGANAGILVGTKLATTDNFRMLKGEVTAILSGLTAAEGQGLLFGIADGDLTLVEIEEALDLNGPLDMGDLVIAEQAGRPVFVLGVYEIMEVASTQGLFRDKLTGAPMITHKTRWTFRDASKGWNYFVYSPGAAFTTGATVKIHAKSFGVWVNA